MKNNYKLILTSVVTGIASSLCCIVPILALISGTTGIAASFSWLEPFRPYLLWITIVVLSYAWYQKLKKPKLPDCTCDCKTKKTTFLQSKTFLAILTIFVLLTTTFPYYANTFYPKETTSAVQINKQKLDSLHFNIEGMTCKSCEIHINHAVKKLKGIVSVETSYKKQTTNIIFDQSKTTEKQIKEAIKTTGYKIK